MIDLSRKPKKQEEENDDVLNVIAAIGTLAFVFLMWLVFTTGFINGIY